MKRCSSIAIAIALSLAACGGSEDRSSEPIVVDETGTGGDQQAAPGEGEPPGRVVVGEDPCTTDADCVPADCCHAAACVARANAPDCGDAVCTTECRFGTTDCGGGCLCRDGRCAARLSEAPQLEVH